MNDAPPPGPAPAPVWSPLVRAGFRLSFCYLALYLLMNGNVTVFSLIPFAPRFVYQPGAALAAWVGTHLFHLTGTAARWHGGGSGDTTLDYVRILCFAVIALAAALIWSVLDWRRPSYPGLLAWLRFLTRLTAGLGMLIYAFAKIYPLQMRVPSFPILNNTYGNSSPFTLLWTMIGLHPFYEIACGVSELIGGLLLLWRRTATLGAIVSAIVMTNVVLFNFCFDVPVKIYSVHLLAMCLFLLLPEASALWRLFVLRRPALLDASWVPPFRGTVGRVSICIVECIFFFGLPLVFAIQGAIVWRLLSSAAAPTPITGAWKIDSIEAEPLYLPLSPEHELWDTLYIDTQRQGFFRSADGQLWRCSFQYNGPKHTLRIATAAVRAVRYDWTLPDADHLVLTARVNKSPVRVELHRLPAPAHYVLLERPFSWINEWGYER